MTKHAFLTGYTGKRTRTPTPTPPSANRFSYSDLQPQMRNVEAIVVQGADAIYQYLLRRAPRTTTQIAEKVGLKKDIVARRLSDDPRFRREKQGWVAVPPEPESEQPPPPPPTAGERIHAYLKEHGDATTQDIAEALGILPGTVATALANDCGAQRVGQRKVPGVRPANLWGIR